MQVDVAETALEEIHRTQRRQSCPQILRANTRGDLPVAVAQHVEGRLHVLRPYQYVDVVRHAATLRRRVQGDAAGALDQHHHASGIRHRLQRRFGLAHGHARLGPQHLLQAYEARISGMAGELSAEPVGDGSKQPVLPEGDKVDVVLVQPARCASSGGVLVGKKRRLEQLVEPTGRPGPAIVRKAAADAANCLGLQRGRALFWARRCMASLATWR